MKMIEDRKAMAGQGGFTLIELLVVIAILAVLAGAAVIGIGAMRGNAEDQVCATDKKTLETAAEAWSLDPAAPSTNTVTQASLDASGYIKETVGDWQANITRANANDPFEASATAGGPCV